MAEAKFRPPKPTEQLLAIGIKANSSKKEEDESHILADCGSYKGRAIPDNLLQALIPDPEFFKDIPKPKADDWLSCHPEKGQSFAQFVHSVRNIPEPKRNTIFLVPLTFFETSVPNDVLKDLEEFASYFFNMNVQLLKPKAFANKVSHRTNDHTGLAQVHAGDILTSMQSIIPKDAFCVGAITLCDLYPKDSWNFVYGLANLQTRTGVYSLARYMPGFSDGAQLNTSSMTVEERATLLMRACRLMCHEISHMFGMKHCIFYHCMMNGSNHFEEADRRPFNLCPVCLRKLQHSCNFSITERYQKMSEFCRDKNMPKEAEWFEGRVHQLS